MTMNAGTMPMERRAGALQGILLVATGALLQTMLITMVSPVLPGMMAAFSSHPNAEILTTLSITSPALSLAILSPLAGTMVDRIGRRTPLLIGLLCYAAFGIIPYFVGDLIGILVSRLFLGAATAMVMTTSMTLLGDFFSGKEREHYLEINAAFAAIFAILTIATGGFLGSIGWNVPFICYAIAAVFFVLILAFTWEPNHQQATEQADEAGDFRWGPLLILCLMVVCGGMVFISPLLFVGVLVSAAGQPSPSTAGMIGAGCSLAVPLGAISFQQLRARRFSVPSLVTLAFLIIGIGHMTIALTQSLTGLIVGFAIQQYGSGYILAGMMIWVLSLLPHAQRGRGTGMYFTSFMIAQPIAGAAFAGLVKAVGGSPLVAMGGYGVLALAVAVILILVCAPRGAFKKDPEEQTATPAG
ncbi:MFS transporter [uncultured Cohaesibacter sp.]|uniref:MFS transporter n=1 Tax=uncultured Cohaesibacter sp. TaxID=1002546 RepID=UPI00292CFD47|nr:MFS transporter [uncultured Cohaesibacter sp.]